MLSAVNYCHKMLYLRCCDPERHLITVFDKVIIHVAQATVFLFNLIAIYGRNCRVIVKQYFIREDPKLLLPYTNELCATKVFKNGFQCKLWLQKTPY